MIKPDEQFMPEARKLYDRGAPLSHIKRKYHMSDSELRDMAPEKFDEAQESENEISGY
jgi:hypothetical protein